MALLENWQQFFEEDYLSVEDHILPKTRTDLEVEQIIKRFQLPLGARILDLGCGTGRLSIPLSQAGFQVVGIDGAPILINAAKAANEQAGAAVEFIHQDMRELDREEEFDAVINFGTAFGYCAHEWEDQDILRRVWRALRPGGQFLMDYENRELRIQSAFGKRWEKLGGKLVYVHREFDCATGHWMEKLSWLEGADRKKKVLHQRFYATTEMIRMCRHAGLHVQEVYGDIDFSRLEVNSPRVLIWAKRGEVE
ncbi:class I SAM-dependent methyltransferase [Brevibacillus migulae]|uniref:class I SAM-dependent methyltransferase n=1 Tax=Brevibacillus migulae TaxID=1644114 RepID=UPI00106DE808|nr:class I SAM-dependent methyltransferase [Brevibacillus migulae]